MKFPLFSLMFLLGLLACNNQDKQTEKVKLITETKKDSQEEEVVEVETVGEPSQSALVETVVQIDNEETQVELELDDNQLIIRLVRQLYKWRENQDSGYDFDVLGDGEKYTSINKEALEAKLKLLKDSNLFGEEFLQNYSQIAIEIDKGLSTGEIEYLEGTLPPYGTGASSWTETQDVLDGAYWNIITIENIAINGDEATLQWFWPKSFSSKGYKIEVKKENGKWRISYMEGFDFEKFFFRQRIEARYNRNAKAGSKQ